jgi:protein-S-isoprenylcysteine O-methyltransferase Ste14
LDLRRADLVASILWMGLGLVVVQQSWTMDRLEAQGADPWSVPGLVPGILGAVLVLLGLALLLRSLRTAPASGAEPREREGRHRLAVTLLLCLVFVFGLLGQGLPFWLAAALFVGVFVAIFIWRERGPARSLLTAAVYGLAAGAAIHLLFQEVFLVRLP